MTCVPILAYHSIDDEASPISLRPEVFAWQMRWLHDHGYQVVGIAKILGHLRGGQPLPPKAVALTFDDGFESVYRVALPILVQHGFPATVFVVPAHCGGTNDWPGQPAGIPRLPLTTWVQIRELDRMGIEIGAHGLNHRRLDELPAEEGTREILDSKACIEDRLGHVIRYFAYPYGRYNHTAKAVARRTFEAAVTAHLNVSGIGSDPWALPRVDAYYVAKMPIFRLMENHVFRPYLGLRRSFRSLASWALGRSW
jgi:peptidoglycan/xylan/chitin deacetylase (PgdA/CDA1 family)